MISMAIKFISVQCPNCLANLNIESGRTYTFCAHCGTKILISNDNEHIYRHIDEARIKEAETERLIRLKEMELKELEEQKKREIAEMKAREEAKAREADQMVRLKEMEIAENDKKRKRILALAGFVVALLFIVVGIIQIHNPNVGYTCLLVGGFIGMFVLVLLVPKTEEKKVSTAPRIVITAAMTNYNGKNVEVMRSVFINAGFTRVQMVPLFDLNLLTRSMQGMVVAISIDKNENIRAGEYYPADAEIVILYHSRPPR